MTLFCSTQLAARIEAAEADLLAAASSHVQRRLPELLRMAIGGGCAVASEPGSPLNKVAGLGFGPLDPEAWAAVEAQFAHRGLPVQVELSTLAEPALGSFFTSRGYQLVGVENVLGQRLPATSPAAVATGPIEVTVGTADDRQPWLETLVTGFATPDPRGVATHECFDRTVLERVLADFVGAAGMVRLLARRGGEIAGAACVRLATGVAQLCGAATLPAHRRQGVQSALLAQRLAFAAAHGAEFAVMTTQPGSSSMQNALRAGFDLLYARNVLVKTPPTA